MSNENKILVSVKALLQGPINGTVMTTTLNNLNLIPVSQPYNVAPFNYAGTETVPAIPAGVTDWVLVELRDCATPATILATRAAFLKSDGAVVDTDGASPVAFDMAAGNYYIAVRHRNHFGIMTAAALGCVLGVPTVFDFTIGAAQTYGVNAQKNMGNGIFAMWAGNVAKGTNAAGKQAILSSASPSDVDQIKGAISNAPGNILHTPSFAGASVSSLYNDLDINLDGNIRHAASPSDVDLAQANVINAPGNIIKSPSYVNLVEQLP